MPVFQTFASKNFPDTEKRDTKNHNQNEALKKGFYSYTEFSIGILLFVTHLMQIIYHL